MAEGEEPENAVKKALEIMVTQAGLPFYPPDF